jgi:DNA-binding beta-propeller fold protein YncE
MRHSRQFVVLAAAAAMLPSLAGAQSYRVAKTVKLGGEGGWDYLIVEPATHRIFISRGTHVMVVHGGNPATDVAFGNVLGDIPNTPGVHGIAFAPELRRGFTSNGRDTTVTIFDIASLSVLDRVHVTGANPDAIVYDPLTKRVFTFNGRGQSTTAIDAGTGKIAGTIPLGGKPEFAASDGRGKMFVNIEDTHELVTFDPRNLKVLSRLTLAGCEEPSGLAFDAGHRRLFSVCGNKVMVVTDPDKNAIVATVPIGEGADAAAFDPRAGVAFSSNGDGTLTIVKQKSANDYAVAQTLPTMRGARTMALDAETQIAYLVTAEFGPAPAPTAGQPRPRPQVIPGSFTLIAVTP